MEEQLNEGFNRRTFVAGAGLTVLGAVAAGMMGCAPSQDSGSADSESDAASSEVNNSGSDPRNANIEMTETINAEVVVVGSGASGLTAAVSAAENGAKVVVVEVLADLRSLCGNSITAVGTSFQAEFGEDWTPEELVADWNKYPDSDAVIDKDAQLFAAQHSAESIDWLIEQGVDIVGVTGALSNSFQDPVRTFVTSADRDGVKAFLVPLKQKAQELGVEFRNLTEATRIVIDEQGAVTGLETVSDGVGTLINLKSLIVAAGGFAASPELLRRYSPSMPVAEEFYSEAKGFMLKQAPLVGAEIAASGCAASPFENVDGGYTDNAGQAMYVTRDGVRWINENLYFLDRIQQACKERVSEYWAIYDTPLYEQVTGKSGEEALATGYRTTGGTAETPDGEDWSSGGDVSAKSIIIADSIEDLARGMNINVASFTQTVDEYNGFCETGIDANFGKPAARTGRIYDPNSTKEYYLDLVEKEFTLLNPLATPPFYGVHMTIPTMEMTATVGGVRTDTNGQVLNVDGNTIPNLYAVGESANGHLISYFYPQTGTSLCMCFCFGRYAGIAAASNAQG